MASAVHRLQSKPKERPQTLTKDTHQTEGSVLNETKCPIGCATRNHVQESCNHPSVSSAPARDQWKTLDLPPSRNKVELGSADKLPPSLGAHINKSAAKLVGQSKCPSTCAGNDPSLVQRRYRPAIKGHPHSGCT